MRIIGKTGLAVLLVFSCAALLTCHRTKDSQSKPKVKIGYIEFVTDLPLFVALERGYFAERGLDVEAVKCGDSNEALNLLLAGQVDAVAHLAFSVYWTAEEKSPGRFKLFLPCYETGDSAVSYFLVRKGVSVSSLSELRGRTVGTITGITQLIYLKLVLERLNMDPAKDVRILQVSPNLQIQALQAGQFDVLFTVDPYGTIAIRNGVGTLLQANPRSKNIVDPFWAAAAAMSSQLVAQGVVARGVYQAMAQAVDDIRNDEKGSKLILTKYSPLDSTIASMVGLYKYAKIDEPRDSSKIQDLADKMLKYGALQKRMDAASLLLRGNQLVNNP